MENKSWKVLGQRNNVGEKTIQGQIYLPLIATLFHRGTQDGPLMGLDVSWKLNK